MDSPPRNDEWMPLATQQLRLRHLIRIIGLNIMCSDKCKLYFTLHHKLDSPPFYKSAIIQHCTNSEAILWDYISCPEIHKSNLRTVCIRVWEEEDTTTNLSTLEVQDKALFSWRVWFSGLILAGSRADAKYFSNTLIFQLNTNCFSSPEHFSILCHYLYDNLHDFDQNTIKVHSTEARELHDGSVGRDIVYSDSTSRRKQTYTEPINDLCEIRCTAAHRSKTSTRQSYSLEALLRIQKIQRSYKLLKQDLQYITEQIINHNLRNKSSAFKGRAIDYFLSDFDQTNPKSKVECKELSKKIEQLRFKCSLLETEREQCRLRNQELINRLRSLKDSRSSRSEVLRENSAQLLDDKSVLCKRIKVILTGVKTKKDIDLKIYKRRSLLCSELKYIYPISKPQARDCFTVSNIPFPDKDYLSTTSLQTDHMKLLSPATLSVTLGFLAHLVQITAIILDKPLRFSLQTNPSIPPKQILYGIYLLNQNIAQLNYDIFQLRLDSRATVENFLKLFSSIIKVGEDESDGSLDLLDDVDRIEDFPKPRSSLDVNHLQVERISRRNPSATDDKRYHSDDDLKVLVERCLKHSYSHERLDKE